MWVPLRQTVIITKLIGTDPDYGDPIYGLPTPVKCRFQEGCRLVRNQRGEEVVSVGTFFFDRLVDIGLSDRLTYTNELGVETSYTPISVSVRRWINGKPVLTEVDV